MTHQVVVHLAAYGGLAHHPHLHHRGQNHHAQHREYHERGQGPAQHRVLTNHVRLSLVASAGLRRRKAGEAQTDLEGLLQLHRRQTLRRPGRLGSSPAKSLRRCRGERVVSGRPRAPRPGGRLSALRCKAPWSSRCAPEAPDWQSQSQTQRTPKRRSRREGADQNRSQLHRRDGRRN